MKIKTLEYCNFKGIKNLKFDLNGKSTVFFGVNGVGKSSILRGINLIFSNIINKIVNNRFKQWIQIELSDISTNSQECTIKVELEFKNNILIEYSRFMNKKTKKRTHDLPSLEKIKNYFNDNYSDKKSNIPVFVNYGVNRLVLDVPLRIRIKHIFDKEAAYEKAIENRIDFRTFFEWFRYQEDFENEQKVRQKKNYEDISLKAVRNAIISMFDGFNNLRIERNPLSMKIDKINTTLSIEQLSDGEKCALALIGDLARRLSLANPSGKNPLLGEGVVLIDEIELHMHPEWQRNIIQKLISIFPNIQFIITTHSPQVLGEIKGEFNIFSLNNINNEIGYTKIDSLIGWDSNYILEDFMNTTSLNIQTKELINSMYKYYENGDYDMARKSSSELEKITNSAHEDIVKINFLLDNSN